MGDGRQPVPIFIVRRTRALAGGENRAARVVGAYREEEQARTAVAGLKTSEASASGPIDFKIESYSLGEVSWQEGFITWAEALEDPEAHLFVQSGDWDGQSVVLVMHNRLVQDGRGLTDGKMLGVFINAQSAEEVIRRVEGQPGFRDYPRGFRRVRLRLGEYQPWADVDALE